MLFVYSSRGSEWVDYTSALCNSVIHLVLKLRLVKIVGLHSQSKSLCCGKSSRSTGSSSGIVLVATELDAGLFDEELRVRKISWPDHFERLRGGECASSACTVAHDYFLVGGGEGGEVFSDLT